MSFMEEAPGKGGVSRILLLNHPLEKICLSRTDVIQTLGLPVCPAASGAWDAVVPVPEYRSFHRHSPHAPPVHGVPALGDRVCTPCAPPPKRRPGRPLRGSTNIGSDEV